MLVHSTQSLVTLSKGTPDAFNLFANKISNLWHLLIFDSSNIVGYGFKSTSDELKSTR